MYVITTVIEKEKNYMHQGGVFDSGTGKDLMTFKTKEFADGYLQASIDWVFSTLSQESKFKVEKYDQPKAKKVTRKA